MKLFETCVLWYKLIIIANVINKQNSFETISSHLLHGSGFAFGIISVQISVYWISDVRHRDPRRIRDHCHHDDRHRICVRRRVQHLHDARGRDARGHDARGHDARGHDAQGHRGARGQRSGRHGQGPCGRLEQRSLGRHTWEVPAWGSLEEVAGSSLGEEASSGLEVHSPGEAHHLDS